MKESTGAWGCSLKFFFFGLVLLACSVADFFGRKAEGKSGPLEMMYDAGCRAWFRQDRVHLLDPKLFRKYGGALEPVHQRQWRGAVPFLPMLRPWHGIWVGRKTTF